MKRCSCATKPACLAALLSFTLILLNPHGAPVAAQTLPGDVDGDGVVDERDALVVGRHLRGLAELTEEQLERADVFPRRTGEDGRVGDSRVTAEDAQVLLRVAVGLVGLGELDMSARLEGDPLSPAWDAIVPRPLPLPDPEDVSPSPSLGGVQVSRTRLSLMIDQGATIGQVNAVLDAVDGQIIGTIPEIGMLLISLPDDGDTQRIESAVVNLAGVAGIRDAGLDLMMDQLVGDADAVAPKAPAPSSLVSGGAPIWTWGLVPGQGNWGMEYIHMPQAWNLNDYVRRHGRRPVRVGVMDGGFEEGRFHPDLRALNVSNLAINSDADSSADHGMHVAGTIGATVDNRIPPIFFGRGVDGANPFVRLSGFPWGTQWAAQPAGANANVNLTNSMGSRFISIVGRTLLNNSIHPRVVNASLGFNWYSNAQLNPYTHADSTALAAAVGHWGLMVSNIVNAANRHRGPVLLCVAAGNDSNHPNTGNVRLDSRLGSPFTWASRNGNPNIVVIESIRPNGLLSSFSNNRGTAAAPGQGILSTLSSRTNAGARIDTAYGYKSGTSMATPHVTGLVSYLLAVDPTLTNAELRSLITTLPNSNTPVGANSAPIIDAWRAVMHIDVLRGDRVVQTGLCNVDDGTAHGNDPRLSALSLDPTGSLVLRTGDGAETIGMADFRRFRDALLSVNGAYPLAQVDAFNAGAPAALINQIKRKCADTNQNGLLGGQAGLGGAPENDNIYSRFDFNGDGRLDTTGRNGVNSAVAARVGRPPTDLEVLADVWPATGSEGWGAGQLPTLLNSGDVEVDASGLFAVGSGDMILRFRRSDGVQAPERRLTAGAGRPVVTLPIAVGSASAVWTVSAFRAFNSLDSLESSVDVTVRLGRLDTLDVAQMAFRVEAASGNNPLRAFAAAGPATPAEFASFAGTPVRVTGSGFKVATEHQLVFFDSVLTPAAETIEVRQSGAFGLPLTLLSTPTGLLGRVPAGATTGRVEVVWRRGLRRVSSRTVNEVWILGPPVVSDMTPAAGRANDDIVIRGRDFGYGAATLLARFTGDAGTKVNASVESVTNGTVRLKVPFGAVDGPVEVVTPAGRVEAGVFTRLEGLAQGGEIFVSNGGDSNEADRVITLREAILLATGKLGRNLIDDDDEDDVSGQPGTLEEGDYVFGLPGAGTADVIRFVRSASPTPSKLRQADLRSITLVAPLPPLDGGYDRISGGQADPTNPDKVYWVQPARVVVQAGGLGGGIAALKVTSDGNEIRLGFSGATGPALVVSGDDNRIIGVSAWGGTDPDSPAIRLVGNRNRLDTCVLSGNLGDGLEISGGAVGNFVQSCLVYDNRRGLLVHGAGTQNNITNANYFGIGSVSSGGEDVEFGPGNRQEGVVIEGGAQGNHITHGRIAGNGGDGVAVRGAGTDDNAVRGAEEAGNAFDIFIGGRDTTASGVRWGNNGSGIVISGGAERTHVLNASVLGNDGDGVRVTDAGTDGTTIESSKIGQVSGDFNEVVTAGNGGSGIVIEGDAQGNAPGGTRVLPQTIVSANGEYGIRITDVRNRTNPTLLRSPLNIGFLPGLLAQPPATPKNIAPPHGIAGMRIERSEYIVLDGGQDSFATDNIMVGEKFGIQIIDSNYLEFGHYFVGRSSNTGILLINSHFNTFKGTRAIRGEADGWVLLNSSNNRIESLDSFFSGPIRAAGAHNSGQGRGLVIGMGSRDNTLDGVTVHDNGGDGVVIDAAYLPPPGQLPADRPLAQDDIADTTVSGTRLVACEIGIELGPIPLGNLGHGLVLRGGATNTELLDNAIAANTGAGILVDAAGDSATAGLVLRGNRVGTHPDGSPAPGYGNGGHGLLVLGGADIDIGGTDPDAGNVFAGNSGDGVRLEGSKRVCLHRNYHGLALDGTSVWANGGHGLVLAGVSDVEVGAEGAGNVLAGNSGNGIRLEGDFARVQVRHNSIGVDAAGSGVAGNGNNGIRLQGFAGLVMDASNRSDIGPANLIAGNNGRGILVDGVTGLRVFDNIVGRGVDGEWEGNGEEGVFLSAAPAAVVRDNTVIGNGGAGIAVNQPVSAGSTLRGNWTSSNGGGGIALFNGSVARPRLTVAAERRIAGRVDLPNGSVVELFGALDGQGTQSLALAQVSGRQFFFPVGVPDEFDQITATATAADGSTSEYSPPAAVVRTR